MKKNVWLSIIAGITAVLGIGVAVFAFFKRKSKKIYQDLDFDDDVFIDEFGSDDYSYIESNATGYEEEQEKDDNKNENEDNENL